MRRLLPFLALLVAAPVSAQWSLAPWSVRISTREVPADRAAWVSETLVAAGTWYRDLGFRAPTLTRSADRYVVEVVGQVATKCEKELGSYNYVSLSLCSGMFRMPSGELIDPATVGRADLEAANRLSTPVHELFHAVQETTLAPYEAEAEAHGWIVEGTATAAEYAWNQHLHGDFGMTGRPDLSLPLTSTLTANIYPLGHFWYRVGEMLVPRGASALAPLRFVFEQSAGWEEAGVAAVDAGLRAAAVHFGAPRAYANGLYDLVPRYLAEHTDERYFSTVPTLELDAPAVHDVEGTLLPLASTAMQVRVNVDEARLTVRGIPVRFTLEALDGGALGDARDPLHLVVGESVAGRPALASTPFTHVVQVFSDTTLLVRVANVAEEAAATGPAMFTLRVEAEGFYGEAVTDGAAPSLSAPRPDAARPDGDRLGESIDAGGALPPGFSVRGPGPWACEGGGRSQAVFDLMTPDEVGRDLDRAVPEMVQDMEDMIDDVEVTLRRLERQGMAAGITPEQMAQLRQQMDTEMARARAEAEPDIAAAADEARAERMTRLMATFVGQTGGTECQMTLNALLSGREGGAQILAGAVDEDLYPEDEVPEFGVMVFPQAFLDGMRAGVSSGSMATPGTLPAGLREAAEAMGGWEVCTMTAQEAAEEREMARGSDCPAVTCTAGQLVLEEAAQGRIAGSFQFEVLRWPETSSSGCAVPEARGTVVGHFNVASTDDGYDDNSLAGVNLGSIRSGLVLIVPGTPILDLGVE